MAIKSSQSWAMLLAAHVFVFSIGAQEESTPIGQSRVPQRQATRTDLRGESYAPVVEKIAASVVTVFTSKNIPRAQTAYPFMLDPRLRRFFGGQNPQAEGQQKLRGLGSGVIIDKEGFVLTANHVVQGADEVLIGFGSELRKHKAKKIGGDPGTDIALLQLEKAENLTPIEFADSDKARPGDIVLALGNPFGLGQTVTTGIVSAVGRGGWGIIDFENFIQTDAAINMGNSGGALVDTHGRLLGINSAIFSRSGGNQGIGFAVPSNLARAVMKSLRENGRVIRGHIGIGVQTLSPELAEALKLQQTAGALVGQVAPNSPAEKAGIKSGDVITGIDGKKITDSREVRLVIGSLPPGTGVKLDLARENEPKSVDVVLAELPSEEAEPDISREQSRRKADKEPVFGGVVVAETDDRTRKLLNVPDNVEGAVVAAVDPSSSAAEAGLDEGSIIQEVNKQPVKSARELVEQAKKLNGEDKVALRVWSQGKSDYIVIDPAN